MNDPINTEIKFQVDRVAPLVSGAVDEFIASSVREVLQCMHFDNDLGDSGRKKLLADLLQVIKNRVNETGVNELEYMLERKAKEQSQNDMLWAMK